MGAWRKEPLHELLNKSVNFCLLLSKYSKLHTFGNYNSLTNKVHNSLGGYSSFASPFSAYKLYGYNIISILLRKFIYLNLSMESCCQRWFESPGNCIANLTALLCQITMTFCMTPRHCKIFLQRGLYTKA